MLPFRLATNILLSFVLWIGKYLTSPRTEGISTTDIVGRMLLMTRSHHEAAATYADTRTGDDSKKITSSTVSCGALINRRSNFLTTSRIIRLFSAGVKVLLFDILLGINCQAMLYFHSTLGPIFDYHMAGAQQERQSCVFGRFLGYVSCRSCSGSRKSKRVS